MRKIWLVFALLLAAVLFLVPTVVRWVVLYEGRYEAARVERPDMAKIEASFPEIEAFVDEGDVYPPGVVLVDVAHENRFDMAELGVLQSRLAARGQSLEQVVATEDLTQQLSYAKALIIISPGIDWLPHEIEKVLTFVEKGGRLLLVTDPTRFGVYYDEWDYAVIDDDVSHVNDLASRFGILFGSDYLYNTTDNLGNFRNIKLDGFASESAAGGLTEDLEQVVFFAAHSILSDEPALISTSGETRSSTGGREDELAVATLAGGGAVLALGDLTFMTEPNNVALDNEQLIANIAAFMSGAEREYELADFPHYFGDRTDLIYSGASLLDSDLLQAGSDLQALFARADRELAVRPEEDGTSDTLFFGLYEGAEEVEPYLAAAGVTVWFTPTHPEDSLLLSESTTETLPAKPNGKAASSPTPDVDSEITATITPTAKNRIEIESLGEMTVTGTVLLLLQEDDDRQVLIVLADTESGLANAGERLAAGELDGCLFGPSEALATKLALCPTGEVLPGNGDGGWEEPEPAKPVTDPKEPDEPVGEPEGEPPDEPPGETAGGIMLVALDHGTGRYDGMTSIDDYYVILEEYYQVELWYSAEEGLPSLDQMATYDLVVWSVGDYDDSLSDEESDLVFDVVLEGVPIMLSGAFIGDSDTDLVQRDIEVLDADHPVAAGFEEGEVIAFITPPSGEVYEMSLLDDVEVDEITSVPLVRGPDSEESGLASMFIVDDGVSAMRLAVIGFPLYLLPEQPKAKLILNTVDWMLRP